MLVVDLDEDRQLEVLNKTNKNKTWRDRAVMVGERACTFPF